MPFIGFISLLYPNEIGENYSFNNFIKHSRMKSWTKMVSTELAEEPKIWPSCIVELTNVLILN